MTISISIGQLFGSLTVLEIIPRGRNKARLVHCVCICGREHSTDAGRLFRGVTRRCQFCANPKLYSVEEYKIRQSYHNYKNGAERRGYDYLLTLEEFRKFVTAACSYCGLAPAKGIDRRNNVVGYLIENCTPCCKQCNLAKRDMTEKEFFAWLQRLAQHQGAWL